jgi:sec-independent protein translocase protein TatA
MPLNIGVTGLLLIVLIALLLFGPSKLPQLGRAIGSTLREFKEGARTMVNEAEEERSLNLKKENDKP